MIGRVSTTPESEAPLRSIMDGEHLIAIVLRREFQHPGLKFITPDAFSLQLGYMQHHKGHSIKAHTHNILPRTVDVSMEALFIKRGMVRVDLYGRDLEKLESVVLQGGDVIFLASGGHGFEVLEETEIIEVKQGPYLGVHDKTLL